MDGQQIDKAIGVVEEWLAYNAPAEVYNAWNNVSEAAYRYSELID